MKTVDEVVGPFRGIDRFDVEGATDALRQELVGVGPPALGQGDLLVLQLQTLEWRIRYVADLLLQVGAAVGALPEGYEVESENLDKAFAFDDARRVYEIAYRRAARLVAAGVHPDQLVIGDVIDEESE